jgi:hypothetical protein
MSQRIRYILPADKSTKCPCGVTHYWRPGEVRWQCGCRIVYIKR